MIYNTYIKQNNGDRKMKLSQAIKELNQVADKAKTLLSGLGIDPYCVRLNLINCDMTDLYDVEITTSFIKDTIYHYNSK
ncbi:MAG: hypothetical protein CML44_13710 [Rhodobacteraceae bacterium]|nr:hypothetical protein [Paracoccaceae bacterium]|tara:strand:+ start:2509 stop:2745 length:237 start_codon:yes stop_codon:yes gene_type:complete